MINNDPKDAVKVETFNGEIRHPDKTICDSKRRFRTTSPITILYEEVTVSNRSSPKIHPFKSNDSPQELRRDSSHHASRSISHTKRENTATRCGVAHDVRPRMLLCSPPVALSGRLRSSRFQLHTDKTTGSATSVGRRDSWQWMTHCLHIHCQWLLLYDFKVIISRLYFNDIRTVLTHIVSYFKPKLCKLKKNQAFDPRLRYTERKK
jgi:hypothetical protein